MLRTDMHQAVRKVAHDFVSERALAAKALVQAARGYEKLGQDKADGFLKLYEQVAGTSAISENRPRLHGPSSWHYGNPRA